MEPYAQARIQITGRPPGLVLHSSELADETNPYAVQIQELIEQSRGRNRLTEEQRDRKNLLQWRGALGEMYVNDEKIVMPSTNLFKAVVTAARELNLGTKIEDRGAVTFLRPWSEIRHDGPDDLDKMYADSRYRLRIPVNPNPSSRTKKLLPVMRPVLPEWSMEADALVITEMIDWDKFCKIMELAGNVGIGNARKIGYGRFDVKVSRK